MARESMEVRIIKAMVLTTHERINDLQALMRTAPTAKEREGARQDMNTNEIRVRALTDVLSLIWNEYDV